MTSLTTSSRKLSHKIVWLWLWHSPGGRSSKKLHIVIRLYFYLMNSLQLLCPDIGSHDYVNQFRSKTISSFTLVHILSHHLHTIFLATNLDDKFERTVKQRSQDVQNLIECLYDKPSVIGRKANLNINRQSQQDVMAAYGHYSVCH